LKEKPPGCPSGRLAAPGWKEQKYKKIYSVKNNLDKEKGSSIVEKE